MDFMNQLMVDMVSLESSRVNVMISQPMTGKTLEEIQEIRQRIIDNSVKEYFKDKMLHVNIIDSIIEDREDKTDIECFAESIKYLAQADYLFLDEKWYLSRGCRFEHDIALAYGIKVIENE